MIHFLVKYGTLQKVSAAHKKGGIDDLVGQGFRHYFRVGRDAVASAVTSPKVASLLGV